METPENFIDYGTLWGKWVCTEIGYHSIITGTAPAGSAMYSTSEVEAVYPAFVNVYETLSSIGCDKYLITHVLKFCILHANGVDLEEFLIQSKTLEQVETALAIGLSGEELTKLISNACPVSGARELPDDMGMS